MRLRPVTVVALAALTCLAACGERRDPSMIPYPIATDGRRTLARGADAIARGASIGRLACTADGPRVGVHLELFIDGQVVLVPSGVGVGPGCAYPIVTRDLTGVLLVRADVALTLADVFAEWGVAFGRTRVAGSDRARGSDRPAR